MNNGNYQYQPYPGGQPSQPVPPSQPAAAQTAMNNTFGAPSAPAAPAAADKSGPVKTVMLVVTSMLSVLFIGLFVWMWVNWSEAQTNVDGRIEAAVAKSEKELTTKLETEFAEKEKYPYNTFSGPADYGSLTFEYNKNWSVYVPFDNGHGSEFNAYFNPKQVGRTDDENPLALRVSIKNEATDEVISDFSDKVEDGEMSVESKVVNGTNVNVYKGKLDSDLNGIVCVFKIRDKTALIQTDALLYENDFNRVLETIRFNK